MKQCLYSREYHPEDSRIEVQGVAFGGQRIVVIAGPCTIEAEAQLHETAADVAKLGALMLRGGAYKIRTSPYNFQGLGEDGLKILNRVGLAVKLPTVTEITDTRDVELVGKYAGMLQIGSRNMQNTALLKAVGKTNYPILLKRGFAATVAEFLAAAEYILEQGNMNVVLCERGIRTFETGTRFSLDILSIPLIKKMSHLPVIVDPSHASGDRGLVAAASLAAIAAGADGLLVEVGRQPENAVCDSRQTISVSQFAGLMSQLESLAPVLQRTL